MRKELIILILLISLLSGCVLIGNLEQKKELNDLQITACNAADDAGTCDTRLNEVGIVLKEDCCQVLGKCCS